MRNGASILNVKRKRASTPVKAILAVGIPLYLAVLAFFIVGVRLIGNQQIYPAVSIDGVDVSWLTKAEAARALDLRAYDARVAGAGVTISFPDGSELCISGEDALLMSDARQLIDKAYSRGRGGGFMRDTFGFLQRMYDVYVLDAEGEDFTVSYRLDMESLRARVDGFTAGYNSGLEASRPRMLGDTIVLVKGAGDVRASESEVFGLAYDGLFKSLARGEDVQIEYYLPYSAADVGELIEIWDSVFVPPLSAAYDPRTKSVSDSRQGVEFDFSGVRDVLGATESGKTVAVVLYNTHPAVTREDLESVLFRDLIGECVTSIAGSANRLGNIVLASEAVDGVVLEPGEEFSFNRTVGRRTSARGYKPGPAFMNGATVQAIGGGICQVSSSIYSAILDSDVKVLERYAHGRPVAYLPRGRDATVSWGSLDFRFMNNTDHPLRIDARVDGRTLTIQVYGTLNP